MTQGTPEEAEKALAEAEELVVQEGGIIHEDALMDAAEAALDGADTEVLVKYINGTATEQYKPQGGWRLTVGRN